MIRNIIVTSTMNRVGKLLGTTKVRWELAVEPGEGYVAILVDDRSDFKGVKSGPTMQYNGSVRVPPKSFKVSNSMISYSNSIDPVDLEMFRVASEINKPIRGLCKVLSSDIVFTTKYISIKRRLLGHSNSNAIRLLDEGASLSISFVRLANAHTEFDRIYTQRVFTIAKNGVIRIYTPNILRRFSKSTPKLVSGLIMLMED